LRSLIPSKTINTNSTFKFLQTVVILIFEAFIESTFILNQQSLGTCQTFLSSIITSFASWGDFLTILAFSIVQLPSIYFITDITNILINLCFASRHTHVAKVTLRSRFEGSLITFCTLTPMSTFLTICNFLRTFLAFTSIGLKVKPYCTTDTSISVLIDTILNLLITNSILKYIINII